VFFASLDYVLIAVAIPSLTRHPSAPCLSIERRPRGTLHPMTITRRATRRATRRKHAAAAHRPPTGQHA
jgi:hypothetical protein